VKIPDMVVGRVSDQIQISTSFVASDNNTLTDNPCGVCNPCAMDKGTCNPCAMKDIKKGQCNPCAMKK
jgi:hypothetical protein